MNSGLDRFELGGITRPGITRSGITGLGRGHFWRRSGAIGTRYFSFVWLPVVLIAGLGAWMLLSGYDSKPAEGEPVLLATAVTGPGPAADTATKDFSFDPATSEAIAPEQRAPVDGLKISSQSWRRGGLGSKALVTFTLRNGNDYAVGDIEISCAFARRDGSHLTDRTRLIHDTVTMKSRKTFARMHIGFVNINASAAKCTLVAANRI